MATVYGVWCHPSPLLTYRSHLSSHNILTTPVPSIDALISTHTSDDTTNHQTMPAASTAARSGKGKNNTVTPQSSSSGVKSSTNTKEGNRGKSNSQPKWSASEGKKYLEEELKDATSRFHNMNINDIHASDRRFNVYPLDNFRTNFRNLKKKIDATNERVEFDNRAVSAHKINYPRPTTTHVGYPHWNGHPAKKHLEDDVRDGTADKMRPQALRDTRQSYKEFPVTVFCQRVHSEKQKQRGAAFWVEKRNRKGMKQRLEEVAETRIK